MSGSIMSGGGVDASIPLQAGKGQAQVNPLESIGQFAHTLNAINQTKLFPQTLAQQTQKTLDAQRSGAYGLLAPMLALPPEQWTHKMATDLMGAGETSGYITQPLQADMVKAPAGDGAAFANYMRPLIATQMASTSAERAAAVSPSVSLQNVGGAIQAIPTASLAGYGNLPPGGVMPSAGGHPGMASPGQVPTYLDPGQLATQVGRLSTPKESALLGIPANTPLTETMLTRLMQQQAPGLINPSMRGAPTPAANGQPMPFPAALRGPGPSLAPQSAGGAAPAPGADAPTGATPGRAIVTGAPPGAIIPQEASAKMYADATTNDAGYNQRMLTLNEGLHALQNTTTGPGTQATNHILSFLQAQAPSLVPKETTDEVKMYDLAVKNLAAWARLQPGAQNSDMQQQLAETANASTHISNAAAQHVMRQAIALQHMDHAAVTQFTQQQGPQNAANYGTWLNQTFTPNHHPMGYVLDQLPRAEQEALVHQYQNNRPALQRLLQSRDAARNLNLAPASQ